MGRDLGVLDMIFGKQKEGTRVLKQLSCLLLSAVVCSCLLLNRPIALQ